MRKYIMKFTEEKLKRLLLSFSGKYGELSKDKACSSMVNFAGHEVCEVNHTKPSPNGIQNVKFSDQKT